MTQPMIRVIKVGGSLLECEQLPQLLTNWLGPADRGQADETSTQAARIDILVAGGGAMVDHVRQLDRRFALDSRTSHWMSVGAMSCTSHFLAGLLGVGLPRACWDELQAIAASGRSQRIVFDAQRWLTETERNQPGVPVTHDWDTTSDSIAARLARVLNADELILLKSTDLPSGIDWRMAAEQGLVDEHFPRIAAELPHVVWINLRQFHGAPAAESRVALP
jgi:aspartokinase-like uncharacterized kinase